MNEEQYLRINFEAEDDLPVDDIKTLYSLMDRGISDFYRNQVKIEDLLGKSNKIGNNRKILNKGFNFS